MFEFDGTITDEHVREFVAVFGFTIPIYARCSCGRIHFVPGEYAKIQAAREHEVEFARGLSNEPLSRVEVTLLNSIHGERIECCPGDPDLAEIQCVRFREVTYVLSCPCARWRGYLVMLLEDLENFMQFYRRLSGARSLPENEDAARRSRGFDPAQ